MKYVAKELPQTGDISRGKFDIKNTLKGLLSAVVTIVFLYLAIVFSANWLAENISDDLESKWLAKVYDGLLSSQPLGYADEMKQADIIFKKLADKENTRDLTYKMLLMDSPMPNAFAIPGGGIGLTTGLLEAMLTEEGMAFILAHELGHHTKRHVLKNFWRAILWTGILSLAGFNDSEFGLLLNFSESGYSRKQEKEADLFALNLAYSLYGDKEEKFLEFFQKIKNDDLNTNGHWSALLSTHPELNKRIDYSKAEIKRLRTIQ